MEGSRQQLKTQYAAVKLNKQEGIRSNQPDNILIWACDREQQRGKDEQKTENSKN